MIADDRERFEGLHADKLSTCARAYYQTSITSIEGLVCLGTTETLLLKANIFPERMDLTSSHCMRPKEERIVYYCHTHSELSSSGNEDFITILTHMT